MPFSEAQTVARRPRGPSPGKTAATRRALTKAALAIFLEHGFAATRMSDVAARAGSAKGTVYLHFADKEALFAEVLREFMHTPGLRRRPQRPRPSETTREFLRRTVPSILREMHSSGRFGVLQLVVAESARFPELARLYREVLIEPIHRLVRLYALRAERRGELRSDALSRMPMLMAAPVVTALQWNSLFSQGDALEVDAAFTAFLDLIFDAPDAAVERTVALRTRSIKSHRGATRKP